VVEALIGRRSLLAGHCGRWQQHRQLIGLLFSADVWEELRLLRSPSRGHRCPLEQRFPWWKP